MENFEASPVASNFSIVLKPTSKFVLNQGPEIPGSLVSEPKRRDSRFKSRLGIGLGTESQTFQVSESEPEPKLRHSKSRNRNRNRKSDIPSLGIGTGIEI